MMERDDLVVVHEPFGDLAGLGETDVAGKPFHSTTAFLDWLHHETDDVNVFLKDTPDERHRKLLTDPAFLRGIRHAFLIRKPHEIAASFYEIEPTMSLASIGLEFLNEFHDAVRHAGGHPPVVVDSDDLVTQPAATMAAYCAAVGLPFIPSALRWEAGDRSEWRRSARWHRRVSATTGFVATPQRYTQTEEVSAQLARYAAYHRPFYDQLHRVRLQVAHGLSPPPKRPN